MKFFIKFFLSFCFLFISGYHYHDTHTCQDVHRYALVKNAGSWKYDGSVLLHIGDEPIVSHGVSAPEHDQDTMTESDDEDDDDREETVSLKKYPEPYNYLVAFSHTQASSGDFCHYIKDRLAYCGHFCCSSSSRYIHFRTIRV